jgi:dynein heavy chain
LELAKTSEILDERLLILIDDITINFYKNICRGLFEKDKLLYSFLITMKIQLSEKKISISDWNFFLRGSAETPD